MTAAPILGLRRAIVTHLVADTNVTALVPAASIYGERTPAGKTWPFVRYGMSDAVSMETNVPIDVFSKADYTDEATEIAEAIGTSLDSKTLTLGDGRKACLALRGIRIFADADEASAWHAIVTLTATVVRDCAAA